MKKIITLLYIFTASTFALTLADVQKNVSRTTLNGDSLDINLKTTVNSLGKKQETVIHVVQKGPSKIYMEVRNSLLNQKSIVNGNRIKTIDINSKKESILPYDGESLESMKILQGVNPLSVGKWSEPKLVSGNKYSMKNGEMEIIYDKSCSCFTQMRKTVETGMAETTFEYDTSGFLKKMETTVDADSTQVRITTEITKLQSSRDFPDRFFEF